MKFKVCILIIQKTLVKNPMYSSIFSMCVQIDVVHCVKSAEDFSYIRITTVSWGVLLLSFPKVKFSSYLFYLYIHLSLSCSHTHSHTHPKTYIEIWGFNSVLDILHWSVFSLLVFYSVPKLSGRVFQHLPCLSVLFSPPVLDSSTENEVAAWMPLKCFMFCAAL